MMMTYLHCHATLLTITVSCLVFCAPLCSFCHCVETDGAQTSTLADRLQVKLSNIMSRFRGNHGDQESVAIGSDEPDGDKIAPQSREHGETGSEKVFTGTEDVQKVVCFELLMLCTMNLCNFTVVCI